MDQRSIDAWPFERMNRSRFGQIGSSGSNCMTRFQMVYTNGARAIGVPGWPELACCTASIERVRIVLIQSWSRRSPRVPRLGGSMDVAILVVDLSVICGFSRSSRGGSHAYLLGEAPLHL